MYNPKHLDSRAKKAVLLKNLLAGKATIEDIINPAPDCVIFYEATEEDGRTKTGKFYGGTPEMNRDEKGQVTKEQIETYLANHPSTESVFFILQPGYELLNSQQNESTKN